MYELIQAAQSSYYIQSPTNVGLVRLTEREVCLIDSGNGKSAARKVRQILDANGWTLRAIYNTHSNADHIGGNRYLQSQTGCKIYAPGVDCAIARHPMLSPSFVYGGYPFADLRHKLLLAEQSEVAYLTQEVLPEGFTLIPLPGHYFDMVGFRTSDDVVYLADCLASRRTLEKYQITFVHDVAAYLQTLERVKTMQAKLFVPAHVEPSEEITELAQYNIDKVWEITDKILTICKQPVTFETLLQRLFADYELTMTFEQHALVGSTVRSYLAWLKDAGRVQAYFENNLMLWHAA